MRRLCIVLIGLLVAGIGTRAFANGEAVNGFPNWSERVLLEWMNRARSAPQIDLAACPAGDCLESACYATASPPRYETQDLDHSSRFHSSELYVDDFFDHWSECTLVSNIATLYVNQQCNGAAKCACTSGSRNAGMDNGTDPFDRMALFGASKAPAGEIIAAGYTDPDHTFYQWLYETADSSNCAFDGANGHRYLILTNADGQNAGAGVVLNTGLPGYQSYSTMDFSGTATSKPKIPSGTHYPEQQASVQAWANWYDTAGPTVHQIDVDGVCSNMTLMRGTVTNGAWEASVSGVGSGCHRYVFSFADSNNQTVLYPTTGSLAIGNGGASCPDWSAATVTPCTNEIFADGFEP